MHLRESRLDSHFLPPGCGRKFSSCYTKKQPKTKKPCRNPWSWPRWPQRDRSWLAYPSCWKHHAGQHCLDLWLWGGWIKHNIPQMVDPSIFRCFLLVSRRENWCWRSVEKRSWFHSDCWFLSCNYLDLQKMRGKNSKNSLPNGGEKWWFTMVQSVKHHLKQIQVDFWPCKY